MHTMSLKKNTLWNLIGTCSPYLIGVFAIPYLIKHLGLEAFGILTLIWALIGYFSIFDMGLGRALTQKIAQGYFDDQHTIFDFIKSGLLLALLAGLLGALVLGLLAHPLGFVWLNVKTHLQQEVVYAILIASLGVPLTTVTSGLKGILEGFEEFKSANVLRVISGVFTFLFPMLSIVLFGPSLIIIVFSLLIARVIIFIGHIYAVYAHYPFYWWGVQFYWRSAFKLLSFGVWMTVSNIISPLMVILDRFIISSVLGAAVVAYYTVPADLLFCALVIPGAFSSALFPKFASMHQDNPAQLKNMYARSLKLTTIVMLMFSIIAAALAYPGLYFWLGQTFAEKSYQIAIILSVGLLFNGIAQIPFAAIQAAGHVKQTAKFHLFECALYLPSLFFLLDHFGVIGAAVAWTLRVLIDLILLLIYAQRLQNNTPSTK